MPSYRRFLRASICFLAVVLICGPAAAQFSEQELLTAAGKPAEGLLKAFLGEPLLEKQVVFDGGQRVREPYLGVAVDGTVLVMQNYAKQLRRSEDGGQTWGEAFEVPFGFLDTNLIVDENTGDILSVRLWDGTDRLWRSSDHGKTWTEQPITLKPNEVMKWIERAGLKRRGTWEQQGDNGIYIMHANAGEAGITLRHGKHKGRLLVTATFRPHAKEHPSDRKPVDSITVARSTATMAERLGRSAACFPKAPPKRRRWPSCRTAASTTIPAVAAGTTTSRWPANCGRRRSCGARHGATTAGCPIASSIRSRRPPRRSARTRPRRCFNATGCSRPKGSRWNGARPTRSGWARQLAERLARNPRTPDLTRELAELDALEQR
jgi:hypothetical protein